jgi:hypothetical protein
VIAHLYLYIAKFDMLWAVDTAGINASGLAVGNLFAVAAAMIIAMSVILLSHPRKYNAKYSASNS